MAMWGDNGQHRALLRDYGEPDTFELRGGILLPTTTTDFTTYPHFTSNFFCEICGGTNHDTSYCRGMGPENDNAMDDRCGWGAPWSDQCFNQGGDGYGWNPGQLNQNWDDRQGFWEGDYENPGFDDFNQGYGGNQFMVQDSFMPPHPYQEAPESYYFQPPQSSFQPPQDPSSLEIFEMLHQIQAELKEEKARMRMLEAQLAQLAEKKAREAREAQEAPQVSNVHRVDNFESSYWGSYEEFEEMAVEKPIELEVEVENPREEPDEGLIQVSSQVGTYIDESLPVSDPGSFCLPVIIRGLGTMGALADLGASVNLMPLSVAKRLDLPLLPPRTAIRLVDGSVHYLSGELEDVPVRVGSMYVSCNFVVMDVKEDPHAPLILGREALRAMGATIDCKSNTITLEVENEKIVFEFAGDLGERMVKRVCMPGVSFDNNMEACSLGEEFVKRSVEWKSDPGGVHPPYRRGGIFGAQGDGSFVGLHGDPGRNVELHPDRCKRDLWRHRPPDVEIAHLGPIPPPDVFDDALRNR